MRAKAPAWRLSTGTQQACLDAGLNFVAADMRHARSQNAVLFIRGRNKEIVAVVDNTGHMLSLPELRKIIGSRLQGGDL